MRGKQCATCNASECRGKRAKRLRAHLGITEVRRPGYGSGTASSYHHHLASMSAAGFGRSTAYDDCFGGGGASASSEPAHHVSGARAVYGDHKYPTIRTGAPSNRVQMDGLMHKCTLTASAPRQYQRVSTRDPQTGAYVCRDDANVRLELSGAVLGKLASFVVVASVSTELGLDKIPEVPQVHGALTLTSGHNLDVEPWGAPDPHRGILLITVAGDTVVAVAKPDPQASTQQQPVNLFRSNPGSPCSFQLFYASRGDLVYVPPNAQYQTRHIGADHILLALKVEPLSFASNDARADRALLPPPVTTSYLAYPLGGAGNLNSCSPSPPSMHANATPAASPASSLLANQGLSNAAIDPNLTRTL